MAKHTKTHVNTLAPGWVDAEKRRMREARETPVTDPRMITPPRRKKWVPWGLNRPGEPQCAHARKGSLKGGPSRAADQVLEAMTFPEDE